MLKYDGSIDLVCYGMPDWQIIYHKSDALFSMSLVKWSYTGSLN